MTPADYVDQITRICRDAEDSAALFSHLFVNSEDGSEEERLLDLAATHANELRKTLGEILLGIAEKGA